MKIPTMLAISLLTVAIVLGVLLMLYNQVKADQLKMALAPTSNQVVNLNATQATIIWQTNQPITGSIIYGTNPTLLLDTQGDARDEGTDKIHIIHFVTLNNLAPQTKYYYKIKNDNNTYPNEPLSFTTPKQISGSPSVNNVPIRGVILEETNPIDEALVLLKLNGASPLATYTAIAGNFLLPLNDLLTSDMTNYLNLQPQTPASLVLMRGNLVSEVTLDLPRSQTLPPVILGQNADFTSPQTATGPGELSQFSLKEKTVTPQTKKYDLNGDGKINAIDLITIINQYGPVTAATQGTDFNGDKLIDQKDLLEAEKDLQ